MSRYMDRGNLGNIITISIPIIDRDREDQRNIIGIISHADGNNNYRIEFKLGIVTRKYTQNQFDLRAYKLRSLYDVSTN